MTPTTISTRQAQNVAAMLKINANYLTSFPQETEKKLWFLDIYIYIYYSDSWFPEAWRQVCPAFSQPRTGRPNMKRIHEKANLSHNDGHSIACDCDPSKPLGDGQFDPAQTVSSGYSGSRLAMWKTWKQPLNVTKAANCHPRLLNNLKPVMELTWCDRTHVTVAMAQNSMPAPSYQINQYDQDA